MARFINPNNARDFNRLQSARYRDVKRLMPFRRLRKEGLDQLGGRHYSDDAAADKVPINLNEMAVNIYRRKIAAHRPRVIITATSTRMAPRADLFSIVINNLLEEIKFERAQHAGITEAMFSQAVWKVGLTYGNEHEIGGFLHDAGQPFADSIGLDDWVHDMSVNRWDQIRYCGNRYTLDYEWAMDTVLKGSEAQAGEPESTNEGGDFRASTLSRGKFSDGSEQPRDTIELWDLYLPIEKLVVTMSAEHGKMKPFRVIEWDGDEQGPYHRLSFNEMPDNIMPIAPVALWIDLHTLANKLFRKLGRQALRQKTNLLVGSGADKDGSRIVNANDGDAIRIDRPEASREAKYGGPAPENQAFLLQVRDLFVWTTGNLDVLGGLSPQAGTLGQEELLSASASERVLDMQERAHAVMRDITRSFMYWEWTDPISTRKVRRKISGDISVTSTWSPETREGDMLQYEMQVDPFSMMSVSPRSKLQALANAMDRFVYPNLELLQAQGKAPDVDKLLALVAKLGNMPELNDIMGIVSPADLANMTKDKPSRGTNQPKEEIRRSVPAPSRHGRDNVMGQALLGQVAQASEVNANT